MLRGEKRDRGWTDGGPAGPDAVEHVGPKGDGHDQVFWVAHPHDIPRFVRGEPGAAGVDAR